MLVNIGIQALQPFDPVLFFRYTGPTKSNAVYINGAAWLTWKEGSESTDGAMMGLPSNVLQMIHLWMAYLARHLPLIIQYLALVLVRASFTPSCWTFRWGSLIMSVDRWWPLGRIIGCLAENWSCAFCNWPLECHRPWSSWRRQNCAFLSWISCREWYHTELQSPWEFWLYKCRQYWILLKSTYFLITSKTWRTSAK